MTARSDHSESFALHVAGPVDRPDLVASLLSCHLGLPQAQAMADLSHAAGASFSTASESESRRLATLLSALGVAVSLRRRGAAARVDLSVQLAVWADEVQMAERLSALLHREAQSLLLDLLRPGGVILTDLTQDEVAILRPGLRAIRGLIVTESPPILARYDIHATRPLTAEESRHVDGVRRLLGLRPDSLTEAVAAGLDRHHRDVLLDRCPGLGLLALDQRFQRFDLMLTGVTGWTTRELADFLVSRTQKPRAAFEQLDPRHPLPLDLGLTLHLARQFCGDYAAIGLLVRPVLSTRGRNT